MMPDALAGFGRREFLAIGARHAWRAIGDVPSGEEAWRRAADLPTTRTGLPDWGWGPFDATLAARQKLAAWLDGTPDYRPPDPATVFSRLVCVGDEVLPHALARLLCRLPAPVRDYTIANVTFILLGCDTLGFAASRVSRPDRPWNVGLSTGPESMPDRYGWFHGLAAHEVAHAWLMPESCADTWTSLETAALRRSPIADVPIAVRDAVARHRRDDAEDERQARALVRVWGFRDIAEDVA